MTLFNLSEIGSEDLHREVDVCVVGGGMAGLVAADRLMRAGLRIAVLESGGLSLDQRLENLNTIDDVMGLYAGSRESRVRLIGGASTLWGGRLLPMTAHDIGSRDYASIDPWPIHPDALQAYTAGVEGVFRLDHTPFERPELARLSRTFGFYPEDAGVSCRFPKFPTFRNRNVATIMRRSVLSQEQVAVYLNATVQSFSLDTESGQVREAVARTHGGSTLRVAARYFVFAAGTIETTRLALVLDRLSEQRAFAGCEVLGLYFHDHIKVRVGTVHPVDVHGTNRLLGYHVRGSTRRSLHCELSAQAQRESSIPSAYMDFRLAIPERSIYRAIRDLGRLLQGKTLPRRDLDLAQQALSLETLYKLLFWRLRHRQLYLSAEIGIDVELRIEQAPIATHRIALSESVDDLDVPRVSLTWSPTDTDRRTFLEALRRFKAYWAQCGLARTSPILWCVPERSAEDYFFASARDASHPAGSTRMGIDPARSVVTSSLRCHGVPNLYLVSASVFPSSGSANPSLTLLQLALRCADEIARAACGVSID